MKKIISFLSLGTLLLSPSLTFAQSKSFDGFSISVAGSAVGTHTKFQEDVNNGDINRVSLGESRLKSGIDAAFSIPFSEAWFLGIGGAFELNTIHAGVDHSTANGDFKFDLRGKKPWSVYLQPTYAVDQSTAFFAKVGYHTHQMHVNDLHGKYISVGNSRSFSDSFRLRGVGYGFGVKKLLSNQCFWQVEAQQVRFDKRRSTAANAYNDRAYYSVKLRSNAGVVSVGYHF